MEISWVLFNQKNGSDAGIRSPEECYIYTTEKEKELFKKNDSETEKMLFYRAQQLVVDVYCKGAK